MKHYLGAKMVDANGWVRVSTSPRVEWAGVELLMACIMSYAYELLNESIHKAGSKAQLKELNHYDLDFKRDYALHLSRDGQLRFVIPDSLKEASPLAARLLCALLTHAFMVEVEPVYLPALHEKPPSACFVFRDAPLFRAQEQQLSSSFGAHPSQ